MPASEHVRVRVDLARVRQNAREVRDLIGPGVRLLAVVKADAYGLGAADVVPSLADLVDNYCVFSLREAVEVDIWRRTGKTSIAIGPPRGAMEPDDYVEHHVRPAVSTADEALQLADGDPVLCVDTGMQRFACPPEDVEAVIHAGGIREAFTHATRVEHVRKLVEAVGGRGLTLHAVGSSLLGEPEARLDAVRPGLALYRGAVSVSARLVEVRDTGGPVGYTGFTPSTGRHGVVLAGYSNGLRPGPCAVHGRPSRVLEVGMQSAYVECAAGDKVGDEVVLVGDGVTEDAVAAAWGVTPQLVLVQLCAAGVREYIGG